METGTSQLHLQLQAHHSEAQHSVLQCNTMKHSVEHFSLNRCRAVQYIAGSVGVCETI